MSHWRRVTAVEGGCAKSRWPGALIQLTPRRATRSDAITRSCLAILGIGSTWLGVACSNSPPCPLSDCADEVSLSFPCESAAFVSYTSTCASPVSCRYDDGCTVGPPTTDEACSVTAIFSDGSRFTSALQLRAGVGRCGCGSASADGFEAGAACKPLFDDAGLDPDSRDATVDSGSDTGD